MHSAGRSWLPGGEEMAPGKKHLVLPGAAGPHCVGLIRGKPRFWGGICGRNSLPQTLKLPLSVLLPKHQPLPAHPPASSTAAELYPDVSLPTTAVDPILSHSYQMRNAFSLLLGSQQQNEAAVLVGWCHRMGCCPKTGGLQASPKGLSAQKGYGTGSAPFL